MKSLKEVISGAMFKAVGYRPQRVSPEAWNREYRDGTWRYLGGIGSIAGLASILGYCQFLEPKTILDVGCGAGVLASKLKVLPYESYLGIDISAEAIAQADPVCDDRTTFAVAEADGFETDTRFDLIIFNQCLNYLPDPAATMAHYAKFLTPKGHVIVSLYETARARAAWPLVAKNMRVADSISYIQAEGRGTTKVLTPA
jgi:predicted TPR repeat methyltransferase